MKAKDSPLPQSTHDYKRFWMLLIYCILSAVNASMWVTYAPISDIAQIYFGGANSTTGSLTSINMLATVYMIFYLPGTILVSMMSNRYDFRFIMLIGAWLSTIAAFVRVIAGFLDTSITPELNYTIVFFGQFLAAMAQPCYLSTVANISSLWFPLHERDIATTISTLSNPVGCAFGQLLPPIFVTQDSNHHVHGMLNLLLIEFVMCVIPAIIAQFLFEAAPKIPPTKSSQIKVSSNTSTSPTTNLIEDTIKLCKNKDYMLLMSTFSIQSALFGAVLTVINQIMGAQGYSNSDAGNMGFVLTIVGLLGAMFTGYLMKRYHAYRTIVKSISAMIVVSFIFFFWMLKPDNIIVMYFASALVGFFLLGVYPVAVENTAECTYPIQEDLSVGIIFLNGNILGIPFIFITQFLQEQYDGSGEVPLLASNIFLCGSAVSCFILILFYNGQYYRLQYDSPTDIGKGLLS